MKQPRLLPVVALVAAAWAAPLAAAAGTPTVQGLFEERRAIEIRSHAERIRILQEADACIRAAADFRAYRACEEREAAGREALRAELRPQLEALRADWQALRGTAPPPR
jgi:hypothetical protein